MLETVILFFRAFTFVVVGTLLSVSFAGMARTRKNYMVTICFVIVSFIAQIISFRLLGLSFTQKIYPLLVHLPGVIFIALYVKRSWVISLTSVFIAYMCCQTAQFIGSIAGAIFNSIVINMLVGSIGLLLVYYLMQKYVTKSVRQLMDRSNKSSLLLAAVPFLYYLLHYAITVYTDLLYSGSRAFAQFFPTMASAFYFVFIIIHYGELQKQATAERERDMMDMQYKQAQTVFATMQQMDRRAITYRHDLRHHFALLQELAANDDLEKISKYLQLAQSEIDTITPIIYCENKTVNLILSTFAARAKQAEIMFVVDAKLPETIPLSSTELCSLLSNAIENALNASNNIADVSERHINVRIYSKNNKLCIDIRNRYEIEPIFNDFLPISNEDGHGNGTESMKYIVEKHGGAFRFLVQDNWFVFQASV